MTALARFSLLLVIILVVVSAYLRLHHAGIGCPDWPACYGRIGAPPVEATNLAESAYQRIVNESTAPLAWAAPLHRLVASTLGLCIVALVLLSLRARRHRLLSLALLGLTIFLALIGLRSGSLHSTAIVMGNLGGGFLMLGLLGWLVFARNDDSQPASLPASPASLRWLSVAALVLLSVQIGLGGLTSANFAATACSTLPDCHGNWLPDARVLAAFDLGQARTLSGDGVVLGGAERAGIHMLHRLGAVLSAAVMLILVVLLLRQPSLRKLAWIMLGLLVLEFAMGVMSVLQGVPISLAVAHNWVAALLLLVLLKLVAVQKPAAASS